MPVFWNFHRASPNSSSSTYVKWWGSGWNLGYFSLRLLPASHLILPRLIDILHSQTVPAQSSQICLGPVTYSHRAPLLSRSCSSSIDATPIQIFNLLFLSSSLNCLSVRTLCRSAKLLYQLIRRASLPFVIVMDKSADNHQCCWYEIVYSMNDRIFGMLFQNTTMILDENAIRVKLF